MKTVTKVFSHDEILGLSQHNFEMLDVASSGKKNVITSITAFPNFAADGAYTKDGGAAARFMVQDGNVGQIVIDLNLLKGNYKKPYSMACYPQLGDGEVSGVIGSFPISQQQHIGVATDALVGGSVQNELTLTISYEECDNTVL